MLKKMSYQLDKKRYLLINIDTPVIVRIISLMNKETNKSNKKNKRYNEKIISFEVLSEQNKIFVNVTSAMIVEEIDKKEKLLFLKKSIRHLTKKQKETLIDHIFNNLSFLEIAKNKNISVKSAQGHYYAAINKLKKMAQKRY